MGLGGPVRAPVEGIEVERRMTQRTREMGIRMAVGASSSDLLKLVVSQTMRLATIGVAIGATGALLLTRSMEGLLYEVSAVDARSFIAVGVLLFVVAPVASACSTLQSGAWRMRSATSGIFSTRGA